ncbi:MAG: SMC-Scp complex subunit ScpB [Clostridia bacterium]|nr:SMC-Scp complex subunit ScpB [Clostridia bacterium]
MEINIEAAENVITEENAQETLTQAQQIGALESVLFVTGEPIPKAEIARVFGLSQLELNSLLVEAESEYEANGRGIRLFVTDETVQLVTNPEYNDWLVKLLSPPQEKNLSDSMMETLSVIAYRQPVTRADIEAVRGVRCEYAVSQLLKQGFIKELGRKDVVGRPMLFGTTDAFLRRFGLHSIEELPPMPEIEEEE